MASADMTTRAKIEQRIERLVIAGAAQEFKGNDFRDLLKPGVYVFLRHEQPIYIGSSKSLLRRVASNHHKPLAIEECIKLLLYPCVSESAARELENLLIQAFQPQYNQSGTRYWEKMWAFRCSPRR